MERVPAPPDIVALAEARSQARQARDWRRADALKADIEAAGWRVVDKGPSFRLWPALPPDVEDLGRHCHGSPDSVPSREQEPDEPDATIVVMASPASTSLSATLAAWRRHAADTRILVVAPCQVSPSDVVEASEVLWTATTFTAGAALRAALRCVTSETVVVWSPDVVPTGSIVAPLQEALADPRVAIAGAVGQDSVDLLHFEPASGEVTAVTEHCYAFRRRDMRDRQPIDDRLVRPDSVATWLSLLLRDSGEAAPARRAVTVPLALGDRPDDADRLRSQRTRAARRDAYRIADRFRDRPALQAADEVVAGLPGQGPDDQGGHQDAHEQGHAGDLAHDDRSS